MERILIVEDDNFSREVFSTLLREEGYVVDSASSGKEALKKLKSADYHVVVTDLVMPDISGLDMLSRVKQLDPSIEVIMVTGHANMETAIYALKNGARDYLIKPINHDEFKHTVALCVEQRRLLDENLELKSLVRLFQASQHIANCLDLERLHSLVVEALLKEVGVDRGLGFFFEGDQLQLQEVKGLEEEAGKRLGELILRRNSWRQDQGEGIILLRNFPPQEARKDGSLGEDLREAMLLVIRSKASILGVVAACNDPGRGLPSEFNRRNLYYLLDQASLAIDNAIRYASARELLNIDELTGLYNYRYLDIALEHEIRRCDRFGANLSVIFLDIDLLKQVNDVHGHLVGSKVLKEVGALIKRSVREVDVVIRYGGDEYTVLLVETGIEGAAIAAERVRQTIEEFTFLQDEGLNLHLTASLGYACYPQDTQSKMELLEMADRAMYQGKYSGKNRVFHISMG